MNTKEFVPLYDYLNNIPETINPDIISAVSYSNILDDISIAMINYRLEHNLNQNQLADIISCSQSLISAYETGARNISTEKLCEMMAKIGKKVSITIEDVEAVSVNKTNLENIYCDSELEEEYNDIIAS